MAGWVGPPPTHAATATVNSAMFRNIVLATHRDHGFLSLVQFPRRGQPAHLLCRIGVADHDFPDGRRCASPGQYQGIDSNAFITSAAAPRSRAVSKSGTTRSGGVTPASRCNSATASTSDGRLARVIT